MLLSVELGRVELVELVRKCCEYHLLWQRCSTDGFGEREREFGWGDNVLDCCSKLSESLMQNVKTGSGLRLRWAAGRKNTDIKIK
jgi:hypothetical protein